MTFCIFVRGLPVSKGSMRAFVRGPRAFITNANPKTRIWEHEIRHAVTQQWGPVTTDEPLCVDLTFCLPRPKAHYNAKGEVKPRALALYPRSKPDLDKLTRTVLDALTALVYRDDSQVCRVVAMKEYAASTGVWITVSVMS